MRLISSVFVLVTFLKSPFNNRLPRNQRIINLSVILLSTLLIYYVIDALSKVCYISTRISLDSKFRRPFPPRRTHLMESQGKTTQLQQLSQQLSPLSPSSADKAISWKGWTLKRVMHAVATQRKEILIAFVDKNDIPSVVNFYIASIAVNSIDNYLFIGTSPGICDKFKAAGIHCFDDVKKSGLNWNELKIDLILRALTMGFSVLYSDVDLIFYVNPFKYISCEPANCDFTAISDGDSISASFIFSRPTPASIEVYTKMLLLVQKQKITDTKFLLTEATDDYAKESSIFKHATLNKEFYQSGQLFYRGSSRYFAESARSCAKCLVVHNNLVPDRAARIYQAKEMHQWIYNTDGYYSGNRKYLLYHNPLKGRNAYLKEVDALKNAMEIGIILNRTVILPKFHRFCEERPLSDIISMQEFDQNFAGLYRESSFLSHPFVPNSIKQSVSKAFLIKSSYIDAHAPQVHGFDFVHSIVSGNDGNGASGLSDKGWEAEFGDRRDPVLRFYALYESFAGYVDREKQQNYLKNKVNAYRLI